MTEIQFLRTCAINRAPLGFVQSANVARQADTEPLPVTQLTGGKGPADSGEALRIIIQLYGKFMPTILRHTVLGGDGRRACAEEIAREFELMYKIAWVILYLVGNGKSYRY